MRDGRSGGAVGPRGPRCMLGTAPDALVGAPEDPGRTSRSRRRPSWPRHRHAALRWSARRHGPEGAGDVRVSTGSRAPRDISAGGTGRNAAGAAARPLLGTAPAIAVVNRLDRGSVTWPTSSS